MKLITLKVKISILRVFHGHWPSNREVTGGGGGAESVPPALLDSEKPCLFRVKV